MPAVALGAHITKFFVSNFQYLDMNMTEISLFHVGLPLVCKISGEGSLVSIPVAAMYLAVLLAFGESEEGVLASEGR